MTLIQQRQQAVQLLGHMKELTDSLPQIKRTKLIAALKEIFSKLDNAATVGSAATRNAKQCFEKV
jgi:hypothetical protein